MRRSVASDLQVAGMQVLRNAAHGRSPDTRDDWAMGYRQAAQAQSPLVERGEGGMRIYAEPPDDVSDEDGWRAGLMAGTADQFHDGNVMASMQGGQAQQGYSPMMGMQQAAQRQRAQRNQQWQQMQAQQAMRRQQQRAREAARRRQYAMQRQRLEEAAEEERENTQEMIRQMNLSERRSFARREQERRQIQNSLIGAFGSAAQNYRNRMGQMLRQQQQYNQRGLGALDAGRSALR